MENNQATAVVVGGQVLSLLLTLVATPVAYSLFDDAANWLRRGKKTGSRLPQAMATPAIES